MTKAEEIIRKYTVVGIDERTGPFKEIKWKEVMQELCSLAFEAGERRGYDQAHADIAESKCAVPNKQQFIDSLFK